jgi:hypothetical protein
MGAGGCVRDVKEDVLAACDPFRFLRAFVRKLGSYSDDVELCTDVVQLRGAAHAVPAGVPRRPLLMVMGRPPSSEFEPVSEVECCLVVGATSDVLQTVVSYEMVATFKYSVIVGEEFNRPSALFSSKLVADK